MTTAERPNHGSSPPDERTLAAYHEAAHAVVRRRMGWNVHGVQIDDQGAGHNDASVGRPEGASELSMPDFIKKMVIGLLVGDLAECAVRAGDPNSSDAVTAYAEIVTRLMVTGPALVASGAISGNRPPPRVDQHAAVYWSQLVATDGPSMAAYLRQQGQSAVSMVRVNWPAIHGVAAALLANGHLSGEELDAIISTHPL